MKAGTDEPHPKTWTANMIQVVLSAASSALPQYASTKQKAYETLM